MLAGCDILNSFVGENGTVENVEEYDEELESSTGKWLLQYDEDTYFTFVADKYSM